MSGVSNLRDMALEYGLELTDSMLEQFKVYEGLMLDWNERINLTAITKPEEVAIKHFLDSLLLLKVVDLPEASRIIDVGTGAGFPSVPMKILRSDLRLTLLDSLNKRVGFLSVLSEALGQQNECVHGRAEQLSHDNIYRECYDLATARAVAALPALCEYCMPYVKCGGYFTALKGPELGAELDGALGAIEKLGGKLEAVREFILPDGSMRKIVLVKKRSHTPTKYPRASVKITKTPL